MCSWISFFCNSEVKRAIALCDHLWEGASSVCVYSSVSLCFDTTGRYVEYVRSVFSCQICFKHAEKIEQTPKLLLQIATRLWCTLCVNSPGC